MDGVGLLLGVLALSTVVGLLLQRRQGRFRTARTARRLPAASAPGTSSTGADGSATSSTGTDEGAAPDATESRAPDAPAPLTDVLTALGAAPGERATLLQFSSAFCAPCRATRRVLGEVAELVPGVAHVEVDAEQHLALVRRLGILSTPTTLVLDAQVRERQRATGQPTRPAVLAALDEALA